ncbi:MAG: hypothetical protein ACPG7W_09655 [Paracoccaceae bacterium]
MIRIWLFLVLMICAGPMAAQEMSSVPTSPEAIDGLCAVPLFGDGLVGFATSLRGIFILTCVVCAAIWGWWGLAMCFVAGNGILVLLPGLLGMAKTQGLDLSVYGAVLRNCATLDFLFTLGLAVVATLLLRDGLLRPRKPR